MPSLSWEGRREAVRAADEAPFLSLQRQESFGTPCGNLLIQEITLTLLNLLCRTTPAQLSAFFIGPLYIRITAFIIMVLTTETFETNGAFGSQQD